MSRRNQISVAHDVPPQKIDEQSLAMFLSSRASGLAPETARYARRWFITRIAERATEIMKENDDESIDENIT